MPWHDPTLSGIERVFAAGANQKIRGAISVQTDRDYHLLSHEVNQSWADDAEKKDWVAGPAGAVDDLRYAVAPSPDTRYYFCHGVFDLVTSSYASTPLQNLMRLRPDARERFTVQQFVGGHLFYTWEASRREFTDAVASFFADATRAS